MTEATVENGTDVYIEAPCGEAALRDAFAHGLGLSRGAVGVIPGGELPPPLGTFDAFVEKWPLVRDYRIRASVFLISDEAEAAAPTAAALGQSLAESLRCGVCIQVADDLDPYYKFMRYRPGAAPDLVTVNLDSLDDEGTMTVRPYFNVLAWPDEDA